MRAIKVDRYGRERGRCERTREVKNAKGCVQVERGNNTVSIYSTNTHTHTLEPVRQKYLLAHLSMDTFPRSATETLTLNGESNSAEIVI